MRGRGWFSGCRTWKVNNLTLLFLLSRRQLEDTGNEEETWNGVAFKYYDSDTYYTPVVRWSSDSAEQAAADATGTASAQES